MEKYVITISRQYGSFGRLVAKELSEQDAAHGRKCEGQKAHADDGDGLYT